MKNVQNIKLELNTSVTTRYVEEKITEKKEYTTKNLDSSTIHYANVSGIKKAHLLSLGLQYFQFCTKPYKRYRALHMIPPYLWCTMIP